MNDKESFEIKLRIKDKEGKIINLNKTVDLEVNWGRKEAKVPQEVVFKKDGKEYRIIIKQLKISKGLLKKSKGSFT
jgi:hypothetical protein